MDLTTLKQRFGIIGNNEALNEALEVAMRVAPTDLSVLITGESGVGKEVFPQIIHANSSRKHGNYIAVNCGAIPEGTIDSELFGHEKGAFTGASESRKGYFEEANGGTIFLDEVAELPLRRKCACCVSCRRVNISASARRRHRRQCQGRSRDECRPARGRPAGAFSRRPILPAQYGSHFGPAVAGP